MATHRPWIALGLLGLLTSALSAQVLTFAPSADADARRTRIEIERQFNFARGDFEWADKPLEDAVKELGIRLGRNFFFAAPANDRRATPVSLTLYDVTYATVFRVLADTAKVSFFFEEGLVFVTTPEDAAKRSLITCFYDIAELLYTPPDFPAPDLTLHPGGVKAEREAPPDEVHAQRDAGEVIDLIRTMTGTAVWDSEGASLTVSRHLLVVRAPPAVQRQVRAYITALRAFL